jgi:hypothetical protein
MRTDRSEAARILGAASASKAGKAGRGDSKRRGDSEHYRRIRGLRRRERACDVCGGAMGVMTDAAFAAAGRSCGDHDD